MAVNYNVRITISGKDQASGVLGRIGQALGSVGNIAAGVLGANIFMGLGHQIAQFAGEAYEAVANYERLGFTLESLLARELSKGELVTETSRTYVQATASQKLALMDLERQYRNQAATLQDLKAEYNSYGNENSRAALQAAAAVEKQQVALSKTEAAMQQLSFASTGYVDVTKQVRINTMDMSEAYTLVGDEARELMKWVEQLALFSPFDMKSVGETLRQAMAYGFAKDEAQRLTEAIVNYTAAAGLTGDYSERIARAMGQVQSKGRLMGEEIRQLTDASIPVVAVLAEYFGKTEEEITKMVRQGLIPADDAIAALTQNMEAFGPVAERQFETWAGLKNAMGDIKTLGMQRVFSGILEPFRGFIAEWVRFMATEGLEKLEKFGNDTGVKLVTLFEQMRTAFTILTGGKLDFSNIALSAEQIAALEGIRQIFLDLKGVFEDLQEPASVVAGYLDEIAVTLGALFVLNKISASFTVLRATLTTIGPLLAGVVASLGGPGIILAAAAIGALYWAWTNNIGGIQEIVGTFWEGTLKPFLEEAWAWLQVKIPEALNWLGTTWSTVWETMGMVMGIISGVLGEVWGFLEPIIMSIVNYFNENLYPVLQMVGNYIETVFTAVWTTLGNFFNEVLSPALDLLGYYWNEVVQPALQIVGDYINDHMMPYWQALADLFNAVVMVALTLIWEFLKDKFEGILESIALKVEGWTESWEAFQETANEKVIPALSGMFNWLDEKLRPVFDWLADNILPAIEKAFNGLGEAVDWVTEKIQDLVAWLQEVVIPDIMKQHSPSPFEQSLMDISTQLGILNAMPFMPNLSGSSLNEISARMRGLSELAPTMGGVTAGLPSESGFPGLRAGQDQVRREIHYHISTPLGREELISLLEEVNLSEGNF